MKQARIRGVLKQDATVLKLDVLRYIYRTKITQPAQFTPHTKPVDANSFPSTFAPRNKVGV